jgi:hypothetical protein
MGRRKNGIGKIHYVAHDWSCDWLVCQPDGYKGVSKRKPSQTKSKPYTSGAVSANIAPVVQASESKPVKLHDTDKDASSTSWKNQSKKAH